MNINHTNNALTELKSATVQPQGYASKAGFQKAEQSTNKEANAELSQQKLTEQLDSERKQASENQVSDAVSKIKEYVQQTERTLDFRVDEDSGQTVVSVLDKSSQKLIRQIPNELALELAQRLNDEEPFNIFKAQV